MRRMVDGILGQYGTEMTLGQGDGAVSVRGFFQPYRSKSMQSIVNTVAPLGEVSRRLYLYIGPAAVAAEEGDVLTVGERDYVFRRVEAYYYGGESTYTWGLCVEKGGEDTWGA